MSAATATLEWTILGYFVLINTGYLLLELNSLARIGGYLRLRALDALPRRYSEHDPPVSLVAPAFNEEALITTAIAALVQMDYTNFEVIVVNDGSTDATLQTIAARYGLVEDTTPYRAELPTEPVRNQYVSPRLPQLRVVDKDNGGKSDANNAGVNAARYPLVCIVDADSILQPDTLRRLVRPFLEDARTIAVGGTVRIANGCRVSDGLLTEPRLPRKILPLIQVLEYLRAFLFGRFGWENFNAIHIISGALGLFDRATLIGAGGYRTDSLGEDLDLTLRLHRLMIEQQRDYRIRSVPDPIVWTEAPETVRMLGRQRIRWQRGLMDALSANRRLLFRRRSGVIGWLNLPFQLIFEGLGPIIEVAGYLYFVFAFATGRVSAIGFMAFLVLAVGVGMLLSATALVLEELSFRVYPRFTDVIGMVGVVVMENLGYRQLVAVWRIVGLVQWATGREKTWKPIERSADWADA